MKKFIKWCLVIALFLLVGAVIYVMIANKASFDEALDLVFVGAGGVGAGIIAFIPIFSKINAVTTNTDSQNQRNTEILSDFEDMKTKFQEQQKEFDKQQKEFAEVVNKQKQEITELKEQLSDVFSICKLGFINSKELVSKGIANQIAKVGVKDENNENEE